MVLVSARTTQGVLKNIREKILGLWVRGDVTHGRRHRETSTPCQIYLDTSIAHPKMWYQIRRLENVLTRDILEMACGNSPQPGVRIRPTAMSTVVSSLEPSITVATFKSLPGLFRMVVIFGPACSL